MKINHLLILALPVLLISCKDKKKSDEKINDAVPVVTRKVDFTKVRDEISASANIEGNKTVKLGFMVAGKVNYIAAEEGQMIKSGQLLASLDPENYIIAKEIADANADQTQDEYNRLSQMFENKSISESDFSKITAALKVAKAQQKLHTKNLAETKIYSPIKGVLLKKLTEVGEIIGVGMPFFVVSDIYSVKVNASVPETDLNTIKTGDIASVYISSLDSTFTGKITEIGAVADPVTRTFSVKIDIKNPNLLIRPGMTAEIKIQTGETADKITIPAQAVLHNLNNSSYIYVADTIKNKAFKRIISLGRIIGDEIEITSGLNKGERIITDGQNKLNDGSQVIIK